MNNTNREILELKDERLNDYDDYDFIREFVKLKYDRYFNFPVLVISKKLSSELSCRISPLYDTTLAFEIERMLNVELKEDKNLEIFEIRGEK